MHFHEQLQAEIDYCIQENTYKTCKFIFLPRKEKTLLSVIATKIKKKKEKRLSKRN